MFWCCDVAVPLMVISLPLVRLLCLEWRDNSDDCDSSGSAPGGVNSSGHDSNAWALSGVDEKISCLC